MTIADQQRAADIGDSRLGVITLCSVCCGGVVFGIDTRKISEVLDERLVRAVPLAPHFVGGLIAYRGEVLTTVSLRALLGHPRSGAGSAVLVLESPDYQERFGLLVDAVEGVRNVEESRFEPNPSTLDALSNSVFAGAYKTDRGLIVHLDPKLLSPQRLIKEVSLTQQHELLEETCKR